MPRQSSDGAEASSAIEIIAAPLHDEFIEHVSQRIAELDRGATLMYHIGVGKLVVDAFYGGDIERAQARGPRDPSLRKLADRLAEIDCGHLSAATLYRMIGIYDLDLAYNVSGRRDLTVTHVRALLGLSTSETERLLRHSETNAWTAQRMEAAAAAARKRSNKDGRGRPTLPAFVKTIRKVGKLIDNDAVTFADLDQIDDLEPDVAAELYTIMTRWKIRSEDVAERLAARVREAGD